MAEPPIVFGALEYDNAVAEMDLPSPIITAPATVLRTGSCRYTQLFSRSQHSSASCLGSSSSKGLVPSKSSSLLSTSKQSMPIRLRLPSAPGYAPPKVYESTSRQRSSHRPLPPKFVPPKVEHTPPKVYTGIKIRPSPLSRPHSAPRLRTMGFDYAWPLPSADLAEEHMQDIQLRQRKRAGMDHARWQALSEAQRRPTPPRVYGQPNPSQRRAHTSMMHGPGVDEAISRLQLFPFEKLGHRGERADPWTLRVGAPAARQWPAG